jgi:hypothetical protein
MMLTMSAVLDLCPASLAVLLLLETTEQLILFCWHPLPSLVLLLWRDEAWQQQMVILMLAWPQEQLQMLSLQ